jgi:hypothetical protein
VTGGAGESKVLEGLGLFWDFKIVCGGGGGIGLRRVGGAIKVLVDHTVEVVVVGLSSSAAADGGGRSPYNPPPNICFSFLQNPRNECEIF